MATKNPLHPGRKLKAKLDKLEVSTARAAEAMGVSRAQLHRVLSEVSAISPELALRIEMVIGGDAESWLAMQAVYDIARVRERSSDSLNGLNRIEARRFNVQPISETGS